MHSTSLRQRLKTKLGFAAAPAFAAALAIVIAAAAAAPARAHAQDLALEEPPLPPGHVPIIVDPPSEPPPPVTQPGDLPLAWASEEDARHHAWLWWRARRARNYLIGSSVATALGAALVFPAEANQCNDTDPNGESTLNRCSPGGKAMVVIGYPLLLVGGIALIASGISLGITKGQLRRFEQRASRDKTRALRWDPASSRFVF